MGGKALRLYTPVRLGRQAYEAFGEHCLMQLQAVEGLSDARIVPSFRAKADFGDLDIVVVIDNYDMESVATALASKETVDSGPVTSFAVPVGTDSAVFQVDLIQCSVDTIDFTELYCSASDTGNLLSKVAATMGLKLRHDGLYVPMRHNGFVYHEIVLTRNFDKALRLLDYDARAFRRGFETQEEAFSFVASSQFFSVSPFTDPPKNAAQRRKRERREMFGAFTDWCLAQPNLHSAMVSLPDSYWHPVIENYFPGFINEYQRVSAEVSPFIASNKVTRFLASSGTFAAKPSKAALNNLSITVCQTAQPT